MTRIDELIASVFPDGLEFIAADKESFFAGFDAALAFVRVVGGPDLEELKVVANEARAQGISEEETTKIIAGVFGAWACAQWLENLRGGISVVSDDGSRGAGRASS